MDHLHFHIRNSIKMRYMRHREYGFFSASKLDCKTKLVSEMIENHKKKKEFEKYMNPKGLKPTITSNFDKMGDEQDFVSHNIMLMRSFKPYKSNIACFRWNPYLSKPEIKQYLMKIYNLNVKKIHTTNVQGKIMQDHLKGGRWRKSDYKKAIVEFDFDVDPALQKHNY